MNFLGEMIENSFVNVVQKFERFLLAPYRNGSILWSKLRNLQIYEK